MQRREKILAGTLGAVFAVAAGGPYLKDTLVKPVTDRRAELLSVSEDVLDKQEQVLNIRTVGNHLLKCERKSLPPDPYDAQRLYLGWITDLALNSGMPNAKITPDRILKRGEVFTGVSVKIVANARMRDLTTFLYRFHRTELMHRIETCKVVSPDNEGDPEMEVTIVAEALSFPAATDRATIFPETALAEEISSQATTLTVLDETAIQEKPPFRVQVADEYLQVTAVDGNVWTVERGLDQTSANSHSADTTVQFAPVAKEMADQTFAEYEQSLLAKNPFVLPQPPPVYRPSYRRIGDRTVFVGEEFSASASVTGRDPAMPEPTFHLVDPVPQGMAIDEQTGRIVWKTTEDLAVDTYPVTVHVKRNDLEDPWFTETFNVSVRERYRPPVVEEMDEVVVYLGQSKTVYVDAYDPDNQDAELTFRISGEPPLGSSVDEKTGAVTLSPPLTTPAGEYQIIIEVSDQDRPPSSTKTTILLYFAQDSARYTKLVGCMGPADALEAWLFDPFNNRLVMLKTGEPFAVANVEGLVTEVGRDFVEYTTGLEAFRLELGQNLRNAKAVEFSLQLPEEPSTDQTAANNDPAETTGNSDAHGNSGEDSTTVPVNSGNSVSNPQTPATPPAIAEKPNLSE